MSPKLSIAQYAREEARAETPTLRWNLPIEHWSPSSLAMMHRCPYQWQQRYIKGRRERPGEAPLIGTAVHAAMERNFDQKITSHEDIPVEELLGWYDDVGFGTVLANEQEHKGEVVWSTDPEKARARGRKMLGEYRNQVAPRVQPTSVEGMFETMAFGLAVPIQGRFDIERESTVIDLKTGKRKQSTPKESWRIQAAVYGEAKSKPVEFHSITATDAGTVSIVTPLESEALLVNPTVLERRQMAINLRTLSAMACLMMEIYGPDQDWPTLGRFHDWACSYCGFRQGCPAWDDE